MTFPNNDPRAAATLYDAAGNPVDVVLDGGVYRLATESTIAAGSELIGTVKIRGSDGLFDANVDASNRLATTSALIIPAGSTDVSLAVQSIITGNSLVDTDYIIPDAKTLTLSQFFGGGEVSAGKASKFELYHSTDGGATDGTLLAFGYIGGSNNFRVDLNRDVLGVGVTQVVRMRRERMDGVSLELASGWLGIQTT